MKKAILFSLLLNCAILFSQSQDLENVITNYVIKNQFNGTILINQQDSIIYSESFGNSNREFSKKNKNNTKFKIASITKLFTAVLIMQLHEKEKLQLNDYINKYLPDYKGEGANKVTIHQLLNATSGIENMEENGDEVYEKLFTTDDILQKYCSGKLVDKPGKVFNYNNADYVILGKIIEAATGLSYAEALDNQILQPLQLKRTDLLNYKVIEELATTYWYNDSTGVIERDVPYYIENYYSAGAMYSTVSDLMTFSDALFTGKLLSNKSLEILLKPDREYYACGLWVFEFWISENQQYKVALRPGNIWGAETVLIRLLDTNINIVILSNMMGTTDMNELQYEIIKNFNK